MRKQQQQNPTALLSVPGIIGLEGPGGRVSQNFKERINQLKAKVKPMMVVGVSRGMSIDESTKRNSIEQQIRTQQEIVIHNKNQQQIDTIHTNMSIIENLYSQTPPKLIPSIPTLNQNPIHNKNPIKKQRSLSQPKILEMHVSYRKSQQFTKIRVNVNVDNKNKEVCIVGKEIVEGRGFNRFKMNGSRGKSGGGTNRDQWKSNRESNKENQVANCCQIEDILISTYKSPPKTDQTLLLTIPQKQLALNSQLPSPKHLQTQSKNPYPQAHKTKPQTHHPKSLKFLNLQNININIDVRQCSSRTHTYTLTDRSKKGDRLTARHVKNSISSYRLK